MNLKACPQCNENIPDTADTCPKCHKVINKKTKKTFLEKLFGTSKQDGTNEQIEGQKLEEGLVRLIDFQKALLNQDIYLSRKTFSYELKKYEDLYRFAKGVNRLSFRKKGEIENRITTFIDTFEQIQSNVKKHNEAYIEKSMIDKKEYLDHILDDDDPRIKLDEEQRKAILTDEDYCLIVAGAGAGKTTTVAGKVKYLVDVEKVDPQEILVISYTNKAVDELRERIQTKLRINAKIVTFHSLGNEIIRDNRDKRQRIIDTNFFIIKKYLTSLITNDSDMLKNLVLFFGYYLDIPESEYNIDNIEKFFDWNERQDLTTLKSNLNEINEEYINAISKNKVTINNEVLRSIQEVQIANFLYLNNIEYHYEKPYKYRILNSTKVYTPDFHIKQGAKESYIEHFGVSEDGKNSRYTAMQLKSYLEHIEDKKMLHMNYHTDLICTYSSYNDKRPLLEHLKGELLKKGYVLEKRSDDEVYKKIVALDQEKYIYRLAILASRFLSNFKIYGYSEKDFVTMRNSTRNARSLLFMDILEKLYLFYQSYLKENNSIDFEDMINESEKMLKSMYENKQKLNYRYIIVDEYQDISHQRFNLAKALTLVSNAKLIAVGDDWQSIFAFAGSDVSLFTNFINDMGYGEELKITHTYRNAQELIDIAGNFVQKNTTQIKKSLVSPKSIKKPIVIFTYDDEFNKNEKRGYAGIELNKATVVADVIGRIESIEGESCNILLIGRYGFDGDKLVKTGMFEYINDKKDLIKCKSHPKAKLTFMTAHSSKGLGFENVIIINGSDGRFGFPSQIEDDPIMRFVINTDNNYEFAEERRLFYVALTRTKNRVFIVAPKLHPSQFVLELISDYTNITIHGDINRIPRPRQKNRKVCPLCGYPLKVQNNKTYGLTLYMCTNEPELCGFMTNNIRGNGNIHCCDKCNDGYMIVRKRKDDDTYFMGCTNWKHDGTGCTNNENIDYSNHKYKQSSN